MAEAESGNQSMPASSTPLPILSPSALPERSQPKSPPLAFEKTPNDSLAPSTALNNNLEDDIGFSNTTFNMGSFGKAFTPSPSLQTVVDKQARALHQLHLAFAAEREAWLCERESMQQRISSLERLLSVNNGHSPAKSPVLAPTSDAGIASPNSRSLNIGQGLPTIVEDENCEPFSKRRRGAPSSIDIPYIAPPSNERLRHNSVFAFSENGSLIVEEIPGSPRSSIDKLSPIPSEHRVLAGHTPLKAPPRPPTPPPRNRSGDDIEDTPTRNNTHINAFLVRSRDKEQDVELTGPLNMPELPNKPGEHNFTEEALRRRLEHIAQSPESEESRPMIFAQPTPGTATPEETSGSRSSRVPNDSRMEKPPAPVPTANPHDHSGTSNASSRFASTTLSPQSGLPHPRQSSHDEDMEADTHRKFDQGGIKLKKKASSNFGAPFGSLGGFGGNRRPS
ncbi:hypothetical protein LTR95_002797 [Oleoguttula sp. CCFEE 5521]